MSSTFPIVKDVVNDAMPDIHKSIAQAGVKGTF